MFSFFRQNLNCGDTVFMVSARAVSEWVIDEIISAGHSHLLKLKKGTDSFCLVEQSRIGKDIFLSKDEAIKETEKQKDEQGRKIFKKI